MLWTAWSEVNTVDHCFLYTELWNYKSISYEIIKVSFKTITEWLLFSKVHILKVVDKVSERKYFKWSAVSSGMQYKYDS
jgi:hypothetical protein